MTSRSRANEPDTTWPDPAWEAEQREALVYELAHPAYDPQVQADGGYYDGSADRDDIGLAGDFRASATPAVRREAVTLTLDADLAQWLRDSFPDWQGEVNGLLRFHRDMAANREAALDPEAFEPGEMIAPPTAPKFGCN